MAEVHEITRTAFEQLLAFPDMCEMLCTDWETPDTEWYLASIWAHFGGKSHFVWVYPAACEREAVTDADNGNERQLRTVATYEEDGRSLHCVREYEVWHVVDDEPEVQPIEKVELPKDSNGMYLHVGDAVRECGWQTVYRVNSLRLEREGWLVMYSVTGDNRGLYGRWAKDLIRLDTRVQPTAER